MHQAVSIFWFRRDLRLHDNHGLFRALTQHKPVLPVFIFDTDILDELPMGDQRVAFIHWAIENISNQLRQLGKELLVFHGKPLDVWGQLFASYSVTDIYINSDHEPYARQRDGDIQALAAAHSARFHAFKDHVVFHEHEVVKPGGAAYTVFTPYARRWREQLLIHPVLTYESENHLDRLLDFPNQTLPSLAEMGFLDRKILFDEPFIPEHLLPGYATNRNLPGLDATTKLGIHLRFGTLSVRKLALLAMAHSEALLNELIWRDFYAMVLWHFPHVVHQAFKPAYDNIEWRNDPKEFEAWCLGKTGYPMVDAGMRQLNDTGYMHNRLRMVTASFLAKHLLIDWRWGEAYFAQKLMDYDLASNNGGWQWAAGSGCDAAPYFRIFNPELQRERFDPHWTYCKKWLPELGTSLYPEPMVDHALARKRALREYERALKA
ncbi:MAG: deoxyribodipyrimidine photo-lyase [Bacteroidetes bacterium]|nr:deoxyribodipyrimidine photo-lyase [Bacteroidota bacterium]